MTDQGHVLYELWAARFTKTGYPLKWDEIGRERQDQWRLVADDFMQSLAPKGNP